MGRLRKTECVVRRQYPIPSGCCPIPPGSDDCSYYDVRNLEVALSVNTDCAVLGVAAYWLEFNDKGEIRRFSVQQEL